MHGASSPERRPKADIQVWDIVVRVFHWTLGAAFLVAYLTGDDLLGPHIYAGYLAAILVVARIVWGFVGSKYARFSNFIYRPRLVIQYANDLLRFRSRRYIGHSPAGGAMIVLLLLMIVLIAATGLLTLAMLEGTGPLAGAVARDRSAGHTWKEIHEVLANITLALILVHIGAVLWASVVHGENLVRSMWNGRKRIEE